MKQLPLPVRIAAGLAVTAVDRARTLPGRLAELPVSVVSQALQLYMRVQQQVTELAIKGDDALSSLRPVEETPEWATFDEDVVGFDASAPRFNAYQGRSKFESVEDDDDPAATWDEAVQDLGEVAAGHTDPADLAADAEQAERATTAAVDTDDLAATDDIADIADIERTEHTADPAAGDVTGADAAEPGSDNSGRDGDSESVELDIVPDGQVAAELAAAGDGGPAALPNYAELSLPQLRARMRRLDIQELQELVEFERAHQNRPDFVGTLTRRISTVRAQK
jgi:hypothetical protein